MANLDQPPRIPSAELRAMLELAAKATLGPWTVESSCVGSNWGFDIPELDDGDYRDSRFKNQADVDFITAARAKLACVIERLLWAESYIAALDATEARASANNARTLDMLIDSRAENVRLVELNRGLADRVVAQSEILARTAAKKEVVP